MTALVKVYQTNCYRDTHKSNFIFTGNWKRIGMDRISGLFYYWLDIKISIRPDIAERKLLPDIKNIFSKYLIIYEMKRTLVSDRISGTRLFARAGYPANLQESTTYPPHNPKACCTPYSVPSQWKILGTFCTYQPVETSSVTVSQYPTILSPLPV